MNLASLFFRGLAAKTELPPAPSSELSTPNGTLSLQNSEASFQQGHSGP